MQSDLTASESEHIIDILRRAAQAEIMPRFGRLSRGEIDTKSGPNDLVTEADRAAEAVITKELRATFPDAFIIGEETVAAVPDARARLMAAPLSFVIDPVDGTWNFAHGLPAFGTMLAACRFGVPVLGMILDPVTGDCAVAGAGDGAMMRGESGTTTLETAPAKPFGEMIGYLEAHLLPPGIREDMAVRAMAFERVSTLHCSAYHYRLLAQGAVDFSMAGRLAPWDHLPGARLVLEAGGYIGMLDGRPYDASCDTGYLLAASSKDTWERLRAHFAVALHL